MKKWRGTLLLILIFGSLARADTAPDAKTLIDKSIDAAGGRQKLEAVQSLTMTADIEMPGQNIKGTLQMARKPEKALINIDLPGIGTVKYGVQGDVAYEASDIMGARLLKDDEKRQMLEGLDPQSQFDRLTRLKDLSVSGPETIAEAKAWKLSGINPTGDAESHWIDTQSFQTIRSQFVVTHQMGKIPATADFSQFKTIDGLTIPMVVTQTVGPAQMVITLKDVKLNPQIPDDQFALPADVVKLVEKQSTKPATSPSEKP